MSELYFFYLAILVSQTYFSAANSCLAITAGHTFRFGTYHMILNKPSRICVRARNTKVFFQMHTTMQKHTMFLLRGQVNLI